MFLNWNNQYFQNDYTTQSNLQSQWNSYQTNNGIFHRSRTKISLFVWKYKKSQMAREILRKKNRTERINLPDFRLCFCC